MKKRDFSLTLFVFCFMMIYSAMGQQQIENPGFEFWEEIGFGPDTLEPVDWSSLKSSDGGAFINDAIPVVWEQSDDAHSGIYSIKLINQPILTLVAPGTLTNGRVHAAVPPTDAYVYTIKEDPRWHTGFTDTPDSLAVWAKYIPAAGDIGHAIAVLHKDTAKIADTTMFNWIAIANIDFTEQTEEWTRFTAPFVYLSSETPEYILFAIYAGDAQASQVGSILYLDDVEMIYNNIGIETTGIQKPTVFFAGDDLVIDLGDQVFEDLMVEVFDLTGKILISEKPEHTSVIRIKTSLPKGIYFCRVVNLKINATQKVFKR